MTGSHHLYRIWLMAIVFTLTGLAFTAAPALACGGGVLCVDADAVDPTPDTPDGLSWTTAFTNVQDALNAATDGDEIWVAEGVYYPDEGAGQTDNSRDATFDLGSGVALYGGFPTGGGDQTFAARDWETYITVLSGDVDGNDSQSPVITDLATVTGNKTNAYHVVTGATGTTLDGFTITAGYADDTSDPTFGQSGGGMLNRSTPQVSHVIFSGNYADEFGGGLFFEGSSLVISNTTFVQNTATDGGGMFVASNYAPGVVLTNTTFLSNTATSGGGLETQLGSGSITLTDVTFTGNKAGLTGPGFGGGMHLYGGLATLNRVVFEGNESTDWGGGFHFQTYVNAAATMNEVSFIGNTAGLSGGGIGMGRNGYPDYPCVLTLTHGIFINNSGGSTGGGGMWQTSGDSTLADVMFSQNEGKDGGGLQVISGTMMLSGATIAGNTAESTGGGIHINAGTLTVANSILWGNTATGSGNQIENGGTLDISYSDIQESGGGGTNIDADPLFVDAANDDLRLSSYLSPAFNAGNNDSVTTSIDLAGKTRIAGAAVDMGAYEIELDGPIITLQKSVTPTQDVTYHGVVTYTLALANVGVQSDTVTLTDTLPTGVAFGGWVSQPAGAIRSGDALTWTGAITADKTITLAFTVTHTGDYGDIITNTAYFSGTGQIGHKAATFAVNRPPTADAGPDQAVRLGPVQLDGSGSSDPEGHALTYSWTQTGGPEVILNNDDAASPTFTANGLGVFTFTLAVTDSFGLADATPDTVVITVLPFLGVLYVDADATAPTPIGVSWTTAYTNVQDALNVATDGNEIWVAEGVYYPDEGAGQTDNDRDATFDLGSGVALYGGFDPQSGMDAWDERDWETYITVLSGDLDQNDSVDAHGVVTDTTAIAGSNAYHVVTTFEVTDTTTLDGFTITAGYADFDDASFPSIGQSGGGMLNYAGEDFSDPFSMFSTPQVSHVIFSGNYAKEFGGGMSEYTFVGATLTDITFVANSADSGGGGGLYIFFSGLGYRDSQFEGLTFVANHASYDGGGGVGGGLLIEGGHLVISNTTFVQNTAAAGGGMLARPFGNSLYVTLMNTTFLSNTAVSGGGLEAMSADGIIIRDVTFTGNKAEGSNGLSVGGGMYLDGGPATLNRVVFENNECTNSHSYGGGFHFKTYVKATATMNEVSFIGNTAKAGGGIHVGRDGLWDNSILNLTHGIFINNSGWWNGGGGMRQISGNSTLADVMFSQNEGNFGGGLFVSGGTMMLSGATIANNTAEFTGGGIHIEDTASEDGNLTVANSILWGNTATESGNQIENRGTLDISYSDIQESGGGGTNIDADPFFADAANDDLRLSYLSPAIDAGNNLSVTTSIDLAGNSRIVDAAVDMGAYELTGPIITLQKSVTPTQGVPYHGVVTYTLALANVGVQSDTVTLTDTLPNGVTFGGWVSQPAGAIRSGNALTRTGDILAEETITLAFTATHTGNYSDIITNAAYFSGTDQTGHNAATFVVNPLVYTLTTAISGSGVITPAAGAHSYISGTLVSLSATAAAGHYFVGWTGDASGTVTPITITLNTDKVITATFAATNINHAPVADAGDGQSVMVGDTVILNGTGSSDPEGYPLTYNWSQTGGQAVSFTPTLSVTTFTAPSSAAVLTFTLAVTDAGGLADIDAVVVTVGGQHLYLPLIQKQ